MERQTRWQLDQLSGFRQACGLRLAMTGVLRLDASGIRQEIESRHRAYGSRLRDERIEVEKARPAPTATLAGRIPSSEGGGRVGRASRRGGHHVSQRPSAAQGQLKVTDTAGFDGVSGRCMHAPVPRCSKPPVAADRPHRLTLATDRARG